MSARRPQAGPTLAALMVGRARSVAPVVVAEEAPTLGRAEWRVTLIAFAFALSFVAVGGRMATLALAEPSEPRIADRSAPKQLARTEIVDRMGRPLAVNLPAFAIYAHPNRMVDADAAIPKIAAALDGVSEETLRARFERHPRFAWVKRPVTPEEAQTAHDLGLPGLRAGPRDVRLYPAGRLGAHILGGVRYGKEGARSAEMLGLAGAERAFDEALSRPTESGAPLKLSIDLSVQAAMTDVLDGAMERFGAIGASAVLMDVRTGAVRALVSLPDFDPNDRPNPNDPAVKAAHPLMNRAAEGVFELGSVFKPITVALALETGLVTPETMIETKSPLIWGGRRIRDFHRMPPRMSVTDIIAESSNVGAARLALMAGAEAKKSLLYALGMKTAPQIELAEARLGRPLLPNPWREISTITVSYGHGIAVTPLHVAVAYAAMTNGGYRVRPTLLDDAKPPTEADRVLSERTSMQMRAILRNVVTNGTARFAEAPGYEVGGKTGTADKPKPGGGYYRDKVISTFAGIFPASDPKYVLVVTLDEPEDRSGPIPRRTAGWTASPVAGETVRRVAPLLGLKPMAPVPTTPAPRSVDVSAE